MLHLQYQSCVPLKVSSPKEKLKELVKDNLDNMILTLNKYIINKVPSQVSLP